MALVTKLSQAPSAAFNDAGGYLLICASSDMPDRDNEVVVPSSLRLEAYKTNPVVLAFHNSGSIPIATCESPDGEFKAWVEGSQLWEQWYFDESPEGATFAGLYQRKVLRGASIGFKSDGLTVIDAREAEKRYGLARRLAVHNGGELLETSAVPVPSCPGALAQSWVDTDALASAVNRGFIGNQKMPALVTKALAPYAARLKTFAAFRERGSGFPRLNAKSLQATRDKTSPPKGNPMSAVTVKAEDEPTPKPPEGDKPEEPAEDQHAEIKAGLRMACHKATDDHFDSNGEADTKATLAQMKSYMDDHDKYCGKEVKEEEDPDNPADDGEEKAFMASVTAFIAEQKEANEAVTEALGILVTKGK